MADTVSLLPLLACCALVATKAGHIIREVDATRELDVQNKKTDSPSSSPLLKGIENMHPSEVVTVADRRAQDAIVNSLRRRFPALHIVGEEGHIEEGPDMFDITDEMVEHWLKTIPDNSAVRQAADTSLPVSSLCVWVDPLDGTKEFACGRVHYCCVLIGITIDGTAYAGVVLEPFRLAADGSEGVLHIGVQGLGLLLQPGQLHPKQKGDPSLVCGSSAPKVVEEVLTSIRAAIPSANTQQCGGCGNKILRVLEGTFDAFFQGKGCCCWDTCAGEALLLSAGAILTDFEGARIRYDPSGTFELTAGIFAARTPQIHEQLLPFTKGRMALS